ncbi:MAG TPA: TIR domain-containing protein [Pyrinomonadaceae bacterium]|nr:TIR domain-containing protein [Pyrinomonadaceae bacterium]
MSPPTIFFSYSHNDGKLRKRLETHLSALKQQSIISTWYDGSILPGHEWDPEIKSNLNSAQIILLLISADFLASDYINRIELAKAMERHQRGAAVVIPVILRPVYWENTPFSKLKVLPLDGKPVTMWDTIDEALENVAQGIKLAAEALMRNAPAQESNIDNGLDLDRPISIRRIRKQEKIDAKVIANVAFHPNGQLMAYSLDNRLFLLELSDVFPERLGVHSKPEHRVSNIAANCERGEFTGSDECEAHIYRITDISFSPNGELVASSDTNGNVKFWSLESRECIAELSAHSDAITSITFSPRGAFFASAGYDEFIHIWRVDNIKSKETTPLKTFEKKSKIKKPARYAHDTEQIISMTFSHNGKHLASGDQQGVVVVREVSTEAEVFRKKIHNGVVAALAFSPTNKALLATASWDKRIRLTNFFDDSKPITLGTGADKHSDSVVSIAFAPGGDILVSSGTDRIVKLWDVEKRRLLLNHQNEDDRPVEKVAFFPNQYDFATDTYSSNISLWDITNEGSMWNTQIDFK